MKIGITGTRNELTQKQVEELLGVYVRCQEYADEHNDIVELHHGDCVGADELAAKCAYRGGFKVVCHPPIKEDLRAFAPAHEFREPKNYFERNRAIVDEVDMLIVLPMQMEHQDKGGTWYTHDYAVKKKVPVRIIWPK